MVFVLFGLSLLIFYLTRGSLPSTFALAPYITPRMTELQKLELAKSLGVATPTCPSFQAFSNLQPSCLVPVWAQYGSWLKNVLVGNWGYTLLPGIAGTQTTWNVFFSRFPYTVELAVFGAILTIAIGIPFGIISATHNNKLPDHVSRIISLGGYSIPQFWFGDMLPILLVLYVRVGGSDCSPGAARSPHSARYVSRARAPPQHTRAPRSSTASCPETLNTRGTDSSLSYFPP